MSRITTLLLGHGLSAVLTFTRNLLLARQLGLEAYSIAIALSVLLAAVELMTSLGVPQLCVSHARGGQRQMQAGLHGLQLLRGLVGALLVLALATPLAQVLGIPSQGSLFAGAAIIPLLMGLCHLDTFRAQRHRRHVPQTVLAALPPAVSIGTILALQHSLNTPILMLWALVAQAVIAVVLSHQMAKRTYQITWSPAVTRSALRFGLPIAANGVLLFSALHLEKLIAGHALGLPSLGLVAMGVTLTLTPHLVAAKSFQAFHLPKLRDRSSGAHRPLLIQAGLGAVGLSVLTYFIAIAALGLLGPNFSQLRELLPLFLVLAAFRLPKSALATIAFARARSDFMLWANIPRLLVAPVIWLALSNGHGIQTLLQLAILAELSGTLIGAWLANSGRRPARTSSEASA